MKMKQTLFERVYNDLHEQIVTQRLPYGTHLPSMRILCDSYHVGIRTVKDVMARLKMEGYIRTEERKPAVVIYNELNTNKNAAVQSILEYKTCILDVADTMFLIMPSLLSFSARACSDYDLGKWKTIYKNLDRKRPAAKTKTFLSFLYDLLKCSNNLLLGDLYTSLELYAKIPLLQNFNELKDLSMSHPEFDGVKRPMEALLNRDVPEIEKRLEVMYEAVRHGIRHQLVRLSREFPDIKERDSTDFTFDVWYERNAFYIQIVRDLIDKIGAGMYPAGSYLPPEAVLAKNYQVSVSTVRRALAMLNEIGFAKTFNAKGTMIVWQEDESIIQCMKNKTLKLETMLYLSGLQLMAILIKPASALAFPHITKADTDNLLCRMDHPDFILFEGMIQCIIDNQTLPPLKIILESIGELIIGGYYYSMFYDGPSSDEAFTLTAKAAFRSLCDGNVHEFSSNLSQCYCHILTYVRDYMVKCGLSEAQKIITP
jgi:DNA-binding FadR family transcriptional regulator